MRLDGAFLHSRLARRVFFMFVACALIPIAGLALISLQSVTRQLDDQTRRRIEDENRAIANGVFERLELLESRLDSIVSGVAASWRSDPTSAGEAAQRFGRNFESMRITAANGEIIDVLGAPPDDAALLETEKAHVLAGRTLLAIRPREAEPDAILLARAVGTSGDVLIAGVEPEYVWQTRQGALPAGSELCVLGAEYRPLFCTAAVVDNAAAIAADIEAFRATATTGRTDVGTLDVALADNGYLASFRDVPVAFRFGLPTLTTVVMRTGAVESAARSRFMLYFVGVVALSLTVVLLMSSIQIRRSLGPVEALQRGTQRIAAHDFKTRIAVSTGDELEQLADSFNVMAERLDKQFTTLEVSGEIDRAILSALDIETIAAAVSERLPALFDSRAVRLVLPEHHSGERLAAATLDDDDLRLLADHPGGLLCDPDASLPGCVELLRESGATWWFLLPIRGDGNVAGAIGLGFESAPRLNSERLEIVQQIGDQVAVAVANARLLSELERLNWGTLMALARAVDAKSPWTAGHSERVTALAVKIGTAMGLSDESLAILYRGGLVHDIGKIGIPAHVLDKPDRLDDDEMALMREHPRKGERILAPIPGYDSVIPIVVQHHERFDGGGYPDGLAGDEIHPNARILAVADVFDALISERPYRAGMDLEKVIVIIAEGAGSHFDPDVVDAFLEVMAPRPQAAPA